MKQIYLFLVSFITGGLITIPLFKALALRLNIIDAPDGNLKKHHKATPYLGGIGVFTALWLVLLFSVDCCSGIFPTLFFGTFAILIVGLIDDICLLTPFKKLVGQLVAALILVGYGFSTALGLPWYADQILALVWLVSLMNAFNLIDVMDGLAVVVGGIATCGLIGYVAYLRQPDLLILLIILLGAQAAFFYHNRPCATIYLGDAGSMLLGATLGAITLKINWIDLNNSWLDYFVAPILLGIPIIEVCSLIIIRRIKQVPFYAGSRDHYIHYLKRKNWSEYHILLFTTVFACLLILISMISVFIRPALAKLALLAITTLVIWLYVVFY